MAGKCENLNYLNQLLSTLIREFTHEHSNAPFIFELETRNRTKDCLVLIRITEKSRTIACMKSAFIVKRYRHLQIFKSYLQYLSSKDFHDNF